MSTPLPPKRLVLINRLLATAKRTRLGIPWEIEQPFLRRYLMGVALEDMSPEETAALLGAARGHLRAGQYRRTGTFLRAFNPTRKNDGFDTPHSAIMVVAVDMPFLVDSVLRTIQRSGRAIHLVMHPILRVVRDGRGKLSALSTDESESGVAESWQYYEIDREGDPGRLRALEDSLRATLADVAHAVHDTAALKDRVSAVCQTVPTRTPRAPSDDFSEARALLEWMLDGHFTLLGARDYRLKRGPVKDRLVPEPRSGLGLLRDRRGAPANAIELTGTARAAARRPTPLVVEKMSNPSLIHGGGYLDCVSVKSFSPEGVVIGERQLLGLWTSSAKVQNPRDIPVLRKRLSALIRYFGVSPRNHDGKTLIRVVEQFPRDELFQIPDPELASVVRGIVNLYDRRMVKLFSRFDRFNRYWSGLLYLPRDAYDADAQARIEALVTTVLGGDAVESHVELSDTTLARIHLIVRCRQDVNRTGLMQLEADLAAAVRTWQDDLRHALLERFDEASALGLVAKYVRGMPASYQAETDPLQAREDIAILETISSKGSAPVRRLYQPNDQAGPRAHLRLYRQEQPRPIADVLPTLENLGFKLLNERLYEITAHAAEPIWIQDFEFQRLDEQPIDLKMVGDRLLATITAVWNGETDNDWFNRLVLVAGITWSEALMLRAYCRWLAQTSMPFSQRYMAEVLITNAATTAELVALFAAQFDPQLSARRRTAACRNAIDGLAKALTTVLRLDEDRVLRALGAAIQATMRTNYYQRAAGGGRKAYLAIKLDPRQVPGVPEPLPHHEVWVHSPRVEGVHVRKGLIARGGIRWSDRYEDFRVEILGLMKAQHVKNTLIIPVGAKGGFVCRRLPTAPASRAQEVTACYQDFIRGLLDLTDNIVAGITTPPEDTVRRDADDTYLVVAADKGTATFSDTANAIAEDYGYWLGDAFASGGSSGYDHKAMAITARGAWECVDRHFYELGIDVTHQDITVSGIGDMSGDVFGNGLLRSPHQRLVAAFNHQHIFLDPNPDQQKSFRERLRLFKLPRSTWADYDRTILSRGGGIFSRTDKRIVLHPAARSLLGLSVEAATPDEVVKAILRLPVDLLWNGGIGTYVKASDESHQAVGDRANDGVRIDGREVRARVVGEGGNLGFSQRGRIEYALSGGRINTDSIDNSGGVNCSDLEVNIKILLQLAAHHTRLTRPIRNRLLARMTDEVASLVLRNNQLQSLAISLLEARASTDSARHAQAIQFLESHTDLSRTLEYLPDAATLAARHMTGHGMTRPELSILLSYSKIWTYQQILDSDLPEDPYLSGELVRYFPDIIADRYPDLLAKHPLRRQIIATITTNSLVNRMGPLFAMRLAEDSGAAIGPIARAYTIAREATDMRARWRALEGLERSVGARYQYQLYAATSEALARSTRWFLARHGNHLAIDHLVDRFKAPIHTLLGSLPTLMGRRPHDAANHGAAILPTGMSIELQQSIDALEHLPLALEMVELALARHVSLERVTHAFLAVDECFHLETLRRSIKALPAETRWQAVSQDAASEELNRLHTRTVHQFLKGQPTGDLRAALTRWLRHREPAMRHLQHVLDALEPTSDLAVITAAVQALKRVVNE